MTAHNHSEHVEGCFRSELSRDELDPRFDVSKPTDLEHNEQEQR